MKAADAFDWQTISASLDSEGWAVLGGLLNPANAGRAPDSMARTISPKQSRDGAAWVGRGEYRYFAYPLPPRVAELREKIYSHLAPIANRWTETVKNDVHFPPTHRAFLKRCHDAGQTRPTPLLLQYGSGDYNCLHQDLYGEHVFPLQVAVLLSEPEKDFTGGEFVLTEQRPRMQSRAAVVPLRQGDGVVFAVNQRPVQGTRGAYRVVMRHGVSALRSGQRHTLGVIFHDAK